LVRRVRAKTLFTTHYHEVTTLADTLESVSNACLQVRDDGGDLTFLFKVLPGVASHSYGIHVARLAGLPDEVVTQAATMLGEPASLPLQIPEIANAPVLRGDAPTSHPIDERLRRIDPLHTTPFEALQLLHELREWVVQGATAEPSPSRAAQ
jgi:DNA mismatch repair protein MutS